MTRPRILVIEDERQLTDVLRYNLERDGYEVAVAHEGQEGLRKAQSQLPDLVILDLMLPRMDGLEVCRRLRAQAGPGKTVPIIMLTAKAEELDKVLGLELGADDYITKPFSIREFRSRVRALLRRAAVPGAASDESERISADGLVIDLGRRTVEVDGNPVQLTYVEFEILRTMVARAGRVFSRRTLLEQLWGDASYRDPRTIDVHIRHLREKVESDPRNPQYIETVRGVGYRFREP